MPIHIDVLARLNQRQTQREADKLADQFESTGALAADKFGDAYSRQLARQSPKIQRAMHAVQNATTEALRRAEEYSAVTSQHGSTSTKALRASEALAKARRAEADAHRSAGATIRTVTREMEKAAQAGQSMSEALQSVGTQAFKITRGLGAVAAAPMAKGLIDVVQVATQATKSLWLLPAAATAGAAAFGTLKLATAGFAEAIEDIRDPEKFAEGLASLSPAAQQAALSIRNLLPQFDQLKTATQDAFFAGMGEQIHRFTTELMPEVTQLTTGIATSFNTMMMNVTNTLMTPGNQANIQTIVDNINKTFQNLAPAASSITQAFVDITAAGSDFLPGIASKIADAAAAFADFIAEARQSGELRTWIQEGLDAMSALKDLVVLIGEIWWNVFGTDAKGNIQELQNEIRTLSEIMGVLTLNTQSMGDTWREELDSMTGPLGAFRDMLMDIPEAFQWIVNKAIDMANGVNHAINKMGENATNALSWLPGDQKFTPMPDIPRIPEGQFGDWGGHDMPAPRAPVDARGNDFGGLNAQRERRGLPPIPIAPGSQYPGPFDVPAPPPDEGRKPSERDQLDAIISGLDPAQWRVDPFAGMPALPPMGPGGGPGQMSSSEALEAERNILSEAHDLEEAKKERLALEKSNTATAKDIEDAKWKELEATWNLQKAQQDMVDKANKTTREAQQGMSELGAALDPDFGLSKGLVGLAENLVKFVGNLALAPQMAKWDQEMRNSPIQGGHGLLGIMGAENISKGLSPFGNPLPTGTSGDTGGGGSYTSSGVPGSNYGSAMPMPDPGVMPSILKDTGSVPSGAQSRAAAAFIQQNFGSQLRKPIGGSRDSNTAKGTHDAGLSIDIPIDSDQMALGDQIRDALQANAEALGLKYTIWRNKGQYPGGGGFNQGGHMDHIDAHFNGQGGVPGGMLGMPSGATASASFGGSGVVPVYVTNMGGGSLGLPGIGGGSGPLGTPGPGLGGTPPAPGATRPGAGAEAWRSAVAKTVATYGPKAGIPPNQFGAWTDAIVKQIDTESKGDPLARNDKDSNGNGGTQSVAGLLQYLPSSYASSGGALTGRPYMDPIGQIAGALMAPRTAAGGPDLSAKTGIGAGHGWGPSVPVGSSTAGPLPVSGGSGQSPIMMPSAGGLGTGLGMNPTLPGGGSGADPVGGTGATQIGGLAPPMGTGGGGVGITPGGTIDTAMNLAAAAFPGVGQAAATGMKLASRAIQYGGQLAGIGVQGLMETFLPTGGSQLANNSWLTRFAGAAAGAMPAMPNIAGGKKGQPQPPMQPDQAQAPGGIGQGLGKQGDTNIEVHNHRATEDGTGRDIAAHQQAANTMPGTW